MVFGKKNQGNKASAQQHSLRSRDPAEHGPKSSDNPLARRFHPDDEPETIDLQDPGRFHSAAEPSDPPTAEVADSLTELDSLITRDSGTGKFYIHPHENGTQVYLGDIAVNTSMELRPGDRIRIGQAEFQFLSG